MNVQISPAPVRKSIRVKASQQRAFEVFAAGMGRWWKPEYHLGKSPLKDVIVEPKAGGRWFERDEDDSTVNWGKVLVWEPPTRLVLAWQINSNWQYDPNILTELEIRFTADGDGTRVELEHRNLERFGEKAREMFASFDSDEGWQGFLVAYANEVAKAA